MSTSRILSATPALPGTRAVFARRLDATVALEELELDGLVELEPVICWGLVETVEEGDAPFQCLAPLTFDEGQQFGWDMTAGPLSTYLGVLLPGEELADEKFGGTEAWRTAARAEIERWREKAHEAAAAAALAELEN